MDMELSPIEEVFYRNALPLIKGIRPQVWVDNKYRVDFYIPQKRLVIELDGHEFHSNPEQKECDAKRDRYLSLKGFRVVRFTGREIYRDVNKCIREVIDICSKIPDHAQVDISERNIDNSNPDDFQNHTYYCTYMQKVLNAIFTKHNLRNRSGDYIRLKMDGHDKLSIGVLDENKIYVAYTFIYNGDRAVDPEIILYRYFDIDTNMFEIIPLSLESYQDSLTQYADLDDRGRVIIYNEFQFLQIANYVEGMARRIEFFGFLETEVDRIYRSGE